MKQRIITGLLITSIVLPTFLYGGLPFNLVVFFFIAFGLYEVYAVKKDQWPLWVYLLLIGIVLLLANANLENLYLGSLSLIMGLFLLTVLFDWISPMDISYLFTLLILMSGALRSVFYTVSFGRIELVYVLFVTYITDSGAYFAGYLFGKHKLNERISPKKTIEGAIGGWLVASLLGIGYAWLWIKVLPFNLMIISSLILPIVSQLGDLAFSSLKRYFGIKDFGTIFPAHGGVLDRIDSLLFSLVTFYILLTMFL